MNEFQYRLLQLNLPNITTKKEQEKFLRDLYEDYMCDMTTPSQNVLRLFKEAVILYNNVKLPDYILASVLILAKHTGTFNTFT
jgi:hypothetical protein